MISISDRAAAPETLPDLPARGLTWRPLDPGDAEALHKLYEASETADSSPHRTSLEEAREVFDGEWKSFAEDSIAAIDADGVLRAAGYVEVRPGDTRTVRAHVHGTVHPQARG